MKYKNIKTGVVIETTSKIIGGVWIPVDEIEPEETETEETGEAETTETEVDEEETDGDEYVEEEIDLDEMTKDELVKFAKENEIEVNGKHRKDVIIETILQALEEQ